MPNNENAGAERAPHPDIICLSHLRWNSVFQRPQHILTRLARRQRVFYLEEPLQGDGTPGLHVRLSQGVHVMTPVIPAAQWSDRDALTRALLENFLWRSNVSHYVLWFYTPMALPYVLGLKPRAVVYDCMDELSGFAGAPAEMRGRERELLREADVVFTGGESLYAAKRHLHRNVHAIPSSVDVPHFRRARTGREHHEHRRLPRPRLGYCGVIDERMDLDLVAGIAAARPGWQLILVGPVAKIHPASLPRAANIHYVGQRPYAELPEYLAGWDVALLPFAHNDATRFISPTKTPEYLAAGRPVVATSIRDVVRPYGERGMVRIADSVADFVSAVEASLREETCWKEIDAFLATMSWDRTVENMSRLLDQSVENRSRTAPSAPPDLASELATPSATCQPSTI